MKLVPLLFFVFLLWSTNLCVESFSDVQNKVYALAMGIVFKRYNMVFCPKIFKYTGPPDIDSEGMEHFFASITAYSSYVVELMETCCKSLHQCDVQKRAELKNTTIEADIRSCECENQFRTCFETPKQIDLTGFAGVYSGNTAKCYSVDHPIIKCEEYKCYYYPDKTYYEYPSRDLSLAIRCHKYKLDESKPKIYQTFQLPFYFEDEYSELFKVTIFVKPNKRTEHCNYNDDNS